MKFHSSIFVTLVVLVSTITTVQTGWAYSHNTLVESEDLVCRVAVDGAEDAFPVTRAVFKNRDTGVLSGSLNATFLYGESYSENGSHVLANLAQLKLGNNAWAITPILAAAATPAALAGHFAYDSWSNNTNADTPDLAVEFNLTPTNVKGAYQYALALKFLRANPVATVRLTGLCQAQE